MAWKKCTHDLTWCTRSTLFPAGTLNLHLRHLQQANGIDKTFGGVLVAGSVHAVVTDNQTFDVKAGVDQAEHFNHRFSWAPGRSIAVSIRSVLAQGHNFGSRFLCQDVSSL
jgi:hypothetical protein